MEALPQYVVITPARNEAQFIELTIRSLVRQSELPLKWVIVSDGSTDGTDEIVRKYLAENPWIELVRTPERQARHFAGKVHAFNAGLKRLDGLNYEVIVSLDGDISFEEDYFAFLLSKLTEQPSLGLVGTPFKESSSAVYDYRFTNIEHVSGACQVFRRKCFEDIGGYVPVEGGCIDHIAVVTARMRGWRTRTFTDMVCFHHRGMGTAQHGVLAARFRNGKKDYSIGNHPLWELFRAVYQTTRKPYIVGSLMVVLGYVWAQVFRAKRPISGELMAFVRREQMQRLRNIFRIDRRIRQSQAGAPS